MANQTISSNTNHDALTGRAAGEDITINSNAKLTIDSCPHLTPMGILGDITINAGEVHIDGRYVKEIVYSNGSGTRPTAIPTNISWDSGSSTGKIIRYDSGDSTSGTITITVQSGTIDDADVVTDGSWSADVDSVRIGFLVVFGEDQVWDALDATATIRVTGDWYQVGTGTGADSQSITLPHAGVQHGVWIETGSGTGVYEAWHRVNTVASSVFFDAVADWGAVYASGKVFGHTPGTSTLNFGTSANGAAPANGAKIVIPNVHMGTTTTGAPTTEYIGVTLGSTLELVDGSVNENVYIDHLNASSVQVSFVQCNSVEVSDSCFGWWNATNIVNKNNQAITFDNCVWVAGTGLTGDIVNGSFIIQDNVGGVTFTDCIFNAGANASNSNCVYLLTMSNVDFYRCKFVSNQQDENSHAALRGSVALNVYLKDCYFNSAGIITAAGCVDWDIRDIVWCQLTSRGGTEDSMVLFNFTGTDTIYINGGSFAADSSVTRHMNGGLALFTDCSNIKMFNFGSVGSKINCGVRGTYVVSVAGITSSAEFKRLFFTNRNTALPFTTLNSTRNIVFENCSCDYNDELENHCNSSIMKGLHGASGNIGAATGWEDDYPGVVDSVFYDCFKSDSVGGVGLLFTPPGVVYGSYVTVDSGSVVFNGIGDVLMVSSGGQVTYEFPYWIKGHTGFTATLPHLLGVNCGTLGADWGNFAIEYDLDTGSGYSNSFKTATTENLTGETILASGFRIKIRIKCTTGSATNSIRGLQVHTSTTIADQASNLYDLDPVEVSISGLIVGSQYEIYNVNSEAILFTGLAQASSEMKSLVASDGDVLRIRVRKSSSGTKYLPYETQVAVAGGTASVYISQVEDVIIA